MPARSSIISEPVSVIGPGCELFELMCANDLKGVVAKRFADPYEPRVRWLKIKNPDYTQKEGKGDLFDWSRQPIWRGPSLCPHRTYHRQKVSLEL